MRRLIVFAVWKRRLALSSLLWFTILPVMPFNLLTAAEIDQFLKLSIDQGDASQVQQAILRGAGVDMRDSDGWTPLHHAAATVVGSAEIIDLLLSAGAPIEARTQDRETPLMVAVTMGNLPVVKRLLGVGAETGVRNIYGISVYQLARANGNSDVITAIRETMTELEYISIVEDLVPETGADSEELAKSFDDVNPYRMTRSRAFSLLGSPTDAYDRGVPLDELRDVYRLYADSRGLNFDDVTLGRLIVTRQEELQVAEAQFFDRVRSSRGFLDGHHGLYRNVGIPEFLNPCVMKPGNLVFWSEGNTLLMTHMHFDERNWDRARMISASKVVKRSIKEAPPQDLYGIDQLHEAYVAGEDACHFRRGFTEKQEQPYCYSFSSRCVGYRNPQTGEDATNHDEAVCKDEAAKEYFAAFGYPEYYPLWSKCQTKKDMTSISECENKARQELMKPRKVGFQKYIIEADAIHNGVARTIRAEIEVAERFIFFQEMLFKKCDKY